LFHEDVGILGFPEAQMKGELQDTLSELLKSEDKSEILKRRKKMLDLIRQKAKKELYDVRFMSPWPILNFIFNGCEPTRDLKSEFDQYIDDAMRDEVKRLLACIDIQWQDVGAR
jgi:hypothetical protein